MGRTFSGCLALAWGAAVVTSLLAADKPAPKKPAEKEFSLSKNWVVLVNPTAKIRGRRPLPTKGLIENFDDLKFTAPSRGIHLCWANSLTMGSSRWWMARCSL